jgi:spermidine synthase
VPQIPQLANRKARKGFQAVAAATAPARLARLPVASDASPGQGVAVRWLRRLYGGHAFISLAYEAVWMRLMTAGLGASLPAMGIVLAVFVAGLGLGAGVWACLVRRRRGFAPGLFAGGQGLLGLWGASLPWLLGWLDRGYAALAPAADSAAHHALRLAVSAALLLPPACLIGAAFPLLGGVAQRLERQSPGFGLARLYRAGLIWSGVGALVTPFWLIPALGLSGTSLLLSALNGLGALLGRLALCGPRQALPEPSPARPSTPAKRRADC